MDALARWLWRPETLADSVVGGVVYGALIVVLFRFVFDDSWAFAIVSGIILAVASFLFTEWSRRRRRTPGRRNG